MLLLVLVLPLSLQAAGEQDEDLRNRQRSIFIYNFTVQVQWPQPSSSPVFRIGVLGKDPVVGALRQMALQRKVGQRSIEVVQLDALPAALPLDLLYVNRKFHFDLAEVLQQISGKNTLLVSENYSFNASMINMIDVDGKFIFELNESRLEQEGFVVSAGLKELAVNSANRWQELYRESAKRLNAEKEKVFEQETLLKRQSQQLDGQRILSREQQLIIARQINEIEKRKKELADQNLQIEEQQAALQSLIDQNNIEQEDYENRLALLSDLEAQSREQRVQIDRQELALDKQRLEFDRQDALLKEQKAKVEEQQAVLDQQDDKIRVQKRYNYLLTALVLLVLGTSFFIYRSLRNRKKTNLELARKNRSIQQKTNELEVQKRAMEQFAFIASHDLKEPLSTISGLVEVLKLDNGDRMDETGKQSMQYILDASNRMSNRIDGLLAYSRLGRDVHFLPVDCQAVLAHVQADLSKVINDKGAHLQVDDLPTVQGHEAELAMLFQNLIVNAIKFQAPDRRPSVRINAKKLVVDEVLSDEVWQFSVSDNGIGIPAEHQKEIFGIFSRLHRRNQYEGSGIGLAHCKKIVELHGGKIWVESKTGAGSIFHFTLRSDPQPVA